MSALCTVSPVMRFSYLRRTVYEKKKKKALTLMGRIANARKPFKTLGVLGCRRDKSQKQKNQGTGRHILSSRLTKPRQAHLVLFFGMALPDAQKQHHHWQLETSNLLNLILAGKFSLTCNEKNGLPCH